MLVECEVLELDVANCSRRVLTEVIACNSDWFVTRAGAPDFFSEVEVERFVSNDAEEFFVAFRGLGKLDEVISNLVLLLFNRHGGSPVLEVAVLGVVVPCVDPCRFVLLRDDVWMESEDIKQSGVSSVPGSGELDGDM